MTEIHRQRILNAFTQKIIICPLQIHFFYLKIFVSIGRSFFDKKNNDYKHFVNAQYK